MSRSAVAPLQRASALSVAGRSTAICALSHPLRRLHTAVSPSGHGRKRLGLTLARKLRQQHDEIDRIEGPKGEAKHRAEILEWIKQNPE
jgi:hypothetical protein